MAAVLHVDLLGPGAMTLLGAEVRARSSKTLALLAYLAVEHGCAHGRDRLAALLWPDHGAPAARQSLRQALHALRAAAAGRDCTAKRKSQGASEASAPRRIDSGELRLNRSEGRLRSTSGVPTGITA